MQNLFLSILMLCTLADHSSGKRPNEAIETAVERLRIAMVKVDQATLFKLTSPLLTYGHSNGLIEDQSSFVQSMVSGKYKFLSISLSNQKIIQKGDLAIVRHDFFAATKDRDKPEGTIKLHIMSVWKKQGHSWLLMGRQAIKNVPQ